MGDRSEIDRIRATKPLSDVMQKRGFALRKNGDEYECLCPFHADKNPSFNIFPSKRGGQQGYCQSCGWKGDVLDFVMEFDHVDLPTAIEILGGNKDGRKWDGNAEGQSMASDPYEGWTVLRPPADAGTFVPKERTVPLWNPKRRDEKGRVKTVRYNPSMVFPYRTVDGSVLGYVLRVDLEGGRKITPMILWMRDPSGKEGWSHGAMPEPRPLYGLDRLAAMPSAQVWIVEGEKAADKTAELVAGLPVVVVSWPGGAKSAARANWKPLRGRRCVLWGDADEGGENAMVGWVDQRGDSHKGVAHLLHEAGAAEIKVIPWDKDKPKGWDGADAVADGWSQKDAVAWIRSRITVWTPPETDEPPPHDEPPQGFDPNEPPPHPGMGTTTQARQTQQEDPQQEQPSNVFNLRGEAVSPDDWRTGLCYTDAKEPKLKPRSLQNITLFVTHHRALKGVFAYDEFSKQVMLMKPPPWENGSTGWSERPMTDVDAIRLTGFLETLYLSPKLSDTENAVLAAAKSRSFNRVRDYLLSLKWDGVNRLAGGGGAGEGWLADYFGAEPNEVNRAFGLRWFISAAARALNPGCKADCMLVMEGSQGLKKSSALRALATFDGNDYFTDDLTDINSKDAAMQMQGVVLVEVSEMEQMSRAETNAIKQWLSKQVDRFRPPFGRRIQSFPRGCVLVGTMNPGGNGWMRDETGGRRFYPVAVSRVDAEWIRRDASQLWAEAVHRYHNGEQWWLTPEEEKLADAVREDRYEEDAWSEAIDDFISTKGEVRTSEIMEDCLKIPRERQNQLIEKRIAKHLRHRKWTRVKKHLGMFGKPKWVYQRPDV